MRYATFVCSSLFSLSLLGCGASTELNFALGLPTTTQADVTADKKIVAQASVAGDDQTWAKFTKQAKADCRKNPTQIQVTAASLTYMQASGPTAIADLKELFISGARIYFTDKDPRDSTAAVAYVATASSVTGTGTVKFIIDANNKAALKPLIAKIMDGTVFLGVEGDTIKTPTQPFNAQLKITITIATQC